MKMHITDVGRTSYRPPSRARCCEVTFRSHHIAQHGMRSTATGVAWSVYVSVCCRVTSVSPAKTTKSTEMHVVWCGLVSPRNHQGIRWGRHLPLEQALLRNSNSWVYSDLPAVDILNLIHKAVAAMWPLATTFVTTCLFCFLVVLFIELFSGLQIGIDVSGSLG